MDARQYVDTFPVFFRHRVGAGIGATGWVLRLGFGVCAASVAPNFARKAAASHRNFAVKHGLGGAVERRYAFGLGCAAAAIGLRGALTGGSAPPRNGI